MPTREIQREQWETYFNEFSQTRAGELVTIEVVRNAQDDPRDEVKLLPLVGISFDPKGSEAGSIEIMVGDKAHDHVTHIVTRPVHVYHKDGAGLISDEVNQDEIIEITSSDVPPIVYLRFTSGSE